MEQIDKTVFNIGSDKADQQDREWGEDRIRLGWGPVGVGTVRGW